MNLHNLECYIKLPFNFPIAKTKIKVHKSKEIAERFIKDNRTEFVSDVIKSNVLNDDSAFITFRSMIIKLVNVWYAFLIFFRSCGAFLI